MATAWQSSVLVKSCGALALHSYIDDALPVRDGVAQFRDASGVVFGFHFNGSESPSLDGFHSGNDDHGSGSVFHEALTSSSSSQWVV